MFGLSSIRLGIYVVVAVLFLVLSGTARYFYVSYIEAQQVIAMKEVELQHVRAAAEACSTNTERLAKEAEEKNQVVKKAQDQAAVVAKNNQAIAQKILQIESNDPNRCQATVKLFQDYKAQGAK